MINKQERKKKRKKGEPSNDVKYHYFDNYISNFPELDLEFTP